MFPNWGGFWAGSPFVSRKLWQHSGEELPGHDCPFSIQPDLPLFDFRTFFSIFSDSDRIGSGLEPKMGFAAGLEMCQELHGPA